MTQLNAPRRLLLDSYSLSATLLLLVTLTLASWLISRYWLELRIQEQLQELTVRGNEMINAANEELTRGADHIRSMSRTLALSSSMQHFLQAAHDSHILQQDLNEFHSQFKLVGVWLLNAQGNVLLQSTAAPSYPSYLRAPLLSTKPWSQLIFDVGRQQAKSYYSLPLANEEHHSLLVGTTVANIGHHAQRIELLVTGRKGIIMLANNHQWLGHTLPSSSHNTSTAHPQLPLQTSSLQPEILLLGTDNTPVLLINQVRTDPRNGLPSHNGIYQIHALIDASQIYSQARSKDNIAALIAFSTTGTLWGGLITWLTLKRNRQHQGIMEQAHHELVHLNNKLTQLASTDPLTQCPNRRAAESRLHHEMAQLQRYNHPFCAVMLDLDFFKRINDKYGHDIGDKVLCHFANTARETIRSNDVLARVGGEEFLLILPDTDGEQGLPLAQRLLDTVAANPLYLAEHTIKFTFSGGLAQARASEDISQLLLRADHFLYVAKEQGRCRICSEFSFAPPHSVLGHT